MQVRINFFRNVMLLSALVSSSVSLLFAAAIYAVPSFAGVSLVIGSGTADVVNNPIPITTSISPMSKARSSAGFTITVDGTGFVSGSVLRFNGSNRTTTLVSSTQLTAVIPASDLNTAGIFSLTVFNPTPGGGTSNTKAFTVYNVNSLPSISPISKTVGSAGFSLTVTFNGAGFTSSPVVRFNGFSRTTIFVASNQLRVTIPASDLTMAGTFNITVVNPLSLLFSNAQTFTVNNPLPTTTSISPTSVIQGDPDVTLIVNGTNFLTDSVVKFNGSSLVTTYVSPSQLVATIPSLNLANSGTFGVTVFNLAPGGGISGAQTFTVVPAGAKVVTSCADVQGSGSYVLNGDLNTGAIASCFNVENTSNVSIDCQGHSIVFPQTTSPIVFKNVNTFSISSCNFKVKNANLPFSWIIDVSNSANGIISHNTFYDSTAVYNPIGSTSNMLPGFVIDLTNTSNTEFSGNTVYGSYQQTSGNNNVIKNNIISPDTELLRPFNGAAEIILLKGSGNSVINNSLNGLSNLVYNIGADDGIVLEDESNDIISGNTIKNHYDCGIETTGLIQNTKITNNSIAQAEICGIGAWYYSSWKGNLVDNNTVDSARKLFYFFRRYGLQSGESVVYFTNNTFSNNKFTNPLDPSSNVAASFQFDPVVNSLSGVPFVVNNNVFTKNNFNTVSFKPNFSPYSMAVDGGSNVCGPINFNSNLVDYPLNCNPINTSLPGTITFTSLLLGIQWAAGTTHSISWTFSGLSPADHFAIYLKSDGGLSLLNISVPGTSTSYSWSIPSNTPLGQYTVLMYAYDAAGNSISNGITNTFKSDFFTIVAP